MYRTGIFAFLALAAIALAPNASALTDDARTADVCLFEEQTLESRDDADLAYGVHKTLAPCTGFGATLDTPAAMVDGVGGLVLADDASSAYLVHGFGLGGKVGYSHDGDSLKIRWSEGITTCWFDIPLDGSKTGIGPYCAY